MTPARLAELLALSEARKARALAALEAAAEADRRLVAELAELAATYARDMAGGVDAAALPALGRRLVWADRRAAAVRAERTALAPRLAALRAEAAQAVGKHRALERLLDDARAEARRAADARAERDAPPRDRDGDEGGDGDEGAGGNEGADGDEGAGAGRDEGAGAV